MTRKDYVAIAAAVARVREATNDGSINNAQDAVSHVIDELTAIFENDNPRFDAPRFIRACNGR